MDGARGLIVAVVFTASCVEASPWESSSAQLSSEILDYYAGVDAATAESLHASLHQAIRWHKRYPYSSKNTTDTWDVLEQADEAPADSGHVLLIYRHQTVPKKSGSKGYNREHIWPKSYGFPKGGSPYSDMHHLFLSDPKENSARGSKPFDACLGACKQRPIADGSDENWAVGGGASGTWETWHGRRGDVARAIFYMAIRYDGGKNPVTHETEPDLRVTNNKNLIASCQTGKNMPIGYMGMLDTLLEWHAEDPVDDIERQHHEVVWSYQGNRNPFIDFPEYAACAFAGECPGTL